MTTAPFTDEPTPEELAREWQLSLDENFPVWPSITDTQDFILAVRETLDTLPTTEEVAAR